MVINEFQSLQSFSLYIQHLVDDICQLEGVATQDIIQALCFCTGFLGFSGFCNLFQWALDKGEWCAQLVTYLCVEFELFTFHLSTLLADTGFLQEVIVDTHDKDQQQENHDHRHDGDHSLGAKLLNVIAGFLL